MKKYIVVFLLLGIGKMSVGQNNPKEDAAQKAFDEGLEFFRVSKFAEAITAYNKVISLNDSMKAAWYNRAVCKLILLDFEASKKDFQKVLQLDSTSLKSLKYLGFIEMRLKNNMTALELFSQAIHLEPFDKISLLNRGIIYLKNNELEAANFGFNKAIELDPEFDQAYFNRGIVKTKKNDHYGAIVDYSIAIRLAPKIMNYYINRGNAKVRVEDYPGAIADYDICLSKEPNNINVLNAREYALSFKDEKITHKKDADKSLPANAKDWQPFIQNAFLKIKNNDFTGGLADLKIVDRVFLNDPVFKFNKGYALFQLKDFKKAQSEFESVIASEEKNGQAYFYRGLSVKGDNTETPEEVCKDLIRASELGVTEAAKMINEWCKK